MLDYYFAAAFRAIMTKLSDLPASRCHFETMLLGSRNFNKDKSGEIVPRLLASWADCLSQ